MPTTTDDLIALPRFSYTALDFETIIADVKRIVQENPEYNILWEDFLTSNAGEMTIELCAYIAELLGIRVDWKTNEVYIGTASQKQSAINLLKLISYRLTLPAGAAAKVDVALSQWVTPFDLPLLMSLAAADRNGNPITFELILKDSDNECIYFGSDAIVTLETGTSGNPKISFTGNDALMFYEGVTYTQSETMEGTDNEEIILTNYPVIEGSIQIWTLNANNEEVEKLPLVTSFVAEEAQEKSDGSALTVPPFMIDVDADNRATVKFGSATLVNTFTSGDAIKIYYRVGGGTTSNIVVGAINETKTFIVGGNPVIVSFINNEAGAGGTSSESIDDARREAPLYVTTAGKAVTPADYRRILLTHSNVFKVAAYGKMNEPAEILNEYGYTIPTYETWLYVVPMNTTWIQLDPRTEYNAQLQITKPYEIKSTTLSFPAPNLLSGKISFDKDGAEPKKVSGYSTGSSEYVTDFDAEIETDDMLVIPGTGTGTEIFVGVVDYVVTGSDDVLYLKEAPTFSATDQNFGISSLMLQIPSDYIPIYRRYSAIDIQNLSGSITYLRDVDYIIDYDKGIITRYSPLYGYGIPENADLQITWWWWDQTSAAVSDINIFDNFLRNKKMLCLDSVYNDTIYTAFDIQGIVYVEKNYNQDLVKADVDALLFFNYSLYNRDYKEPVHLPEIIADIQTIAGVRYVDVQYFGKDYASYKGSPSNPPAGSENYELASMGAEYDEIIILSHNEFVGATISVDYQLHGIVLDYTEVS